jgi:hypothetical protein
MYYEILVNGASIGVFGHDSVRNMHLSVQVVDDGRDVFASAVCEEDGELYFYDWLQHSISLHDRVEFRPFASGPSQPPQRKRKMERQQSDIDAA